MRLLRGRLAGAVLRGEHGVRTRRHADRGGAGSCADDGQREPRNERQLAEAREAAARSSSARSPASSAWRLGVSVKEYQGLGPGERLPSFETWDRICKFSVRLFGTKPVHFRRPDSNSSPGLH
jgi:hypothetical protein